MQKPSAKEIKNTRAWRSPLVSVWCGVVNCEKKAEHVREIGKIPHGNHCEILSSQTLT